MGARRRWCYWLIALLVKCEPILVRLGNKARRIFAEGGIDITINIQIQLAIHDLPAGRRINIEQLFHASVHCVVRSDPATRSNREVRLYPRQ